MTDVPAGMGQPNGRPIPAPDYEGRPYGAEKQLDDAHAAVAPVHAIGPSGDVAGGNAGSGGGDRLARIEQLLGNEVPGNLLDDSEFPDEPGSAGLLSGAGPGPEVLNRDRTPRVTRILDTLAATSGNPIVASLAQEAAARRL